MERALGKLQMLYRSINGVRNKIIGLSIGLLAGWFLENKEVAGGYKRVEILFLNKASENKV